MNPERKPDQELSMLLSAMLDGQMTAVEESRLADLLRDNPDAQESYLDYCRTHALERLKSALNQMPPAGRKRLYGNILRNVAAFYQFPYEFVFSFR